MKTIVVGLGLMGGSMAMAIRKYTRHEVYGWNRTVFIVEFPRPAQEFSAAGFRIVHGRSSFP